MSVQERKRFPVKRTVNNFCTTGSRLRLPVVFLIGNVRSALLVFQDSPEFLHKTVADTLGRLWTYALVVLI